MLYGEGAFSVVLCGIYFSRDRFEARRGNDKHR
jgi:hypothetical protein